MKIRRCLMATMFMCPVAAQADMKRWTENGNGVLTDTFTGLEWTQPDNLSDIDW